MTGLLPDDAGHVDQKEQAWGDVRDSGHEQATVRVDEIGRRLECRLVELQYLASVIDKQASDSRSDLHHDHAMIDRPLDGGEAEPSTQIDDRDDPSANLHESGDMFWRAWHVRRTLERLEMEHVRRGQRVLRATDSKCQV
jgi:hypothetical protein